MLLGLRWAFLCRTLFWLRPASMVRIFSIFPEVACFLPDFCYANSDTCCQVVAKAPSASAYINSGVGVLAIRVAYLSIPANLPIRSICHDRTAKLGQPVATEAHFPLSREIPLTQGWKFFLGDYASAKEPGWMTLAGRTCAFPMISVSASLFPPPGRRRALSCPAVWAGTGAAAIFLPAGRANGCCWIRRRVCQRLGLC